MGEEVFPWLKSLPLAPEYYPTLAEFQDPISYIFKIEEEASKYGICKIIPPVSSSPRKTAIANLNRSLAARNPDSSPTFTTRQQQIGFCPRKHHRPVQKPVWQSGEVYTVPQFEAKAKGFEKSWLKKGANSKKGLTALEVETLYWKAHVDKPFSVEYANDMPGSAFDRTVGGHGKKSGKKEIGEALTVAETEWNMRGVSRSKGSLLKFMKEEIPGVTSPMVYISMLFSWFAWHVEDHDFHSLNYMHLGAGKTWYGVPRDAAVAFEDVIRAHGYGGEINPIVTFATLGEKTTIISPEVLLKAGVPCCRLVQNAGEFVVTFPRAYHSGFSHGFNCGEAANIATPGWLNVARDAAIRRASINCAPMVSHSQLLYDLAVSFSSSVPTTTKPEPRSSRLKHKLKIEGGESLVKRLFLQDILQNNHYLRILGKGSPIVIIPEQFLDKRIPFTSRTQHHDSITTLNSNFNSNSDSDSDDGRIPNRNSMGKFSSFCNRSKKDESFSSYVGRYKGNNNSNNNGDNDNNEIEKKTDPGVFSCVSCGILCYACVAIIRPTEAASRYLMSADCKGISELVAATDLFVDNEDGDAVDSKSSKGNTAQSTRDGLFDVPIKATDEIQIVNDNSGLASSTQPQKVNSSLGLLALAYGDSSDSDDDNVEKGNDVSGNNPALLGTPGFHGDHDDGGDDDGQTVDCCVEVEKKKSYTESNRGTDEECDEDSSRKHIFCLQHALEVEQRLRSVGGVHMLLLCHQDYPSLDSEAKSVAKELETNDKWTDLEFRESDENDEKWIQTALESEDATHGNRDWAVKLGINLFYSASLSRSPLYSKQMPYNLIIYNAFGHTSNFNNNNNSHTKPKRQKKIIVAGKWCGKVWMSNQVHPLLVERDYEDDYDIGSGGGSGFSNLNNEKRFENVYSVGGRNLRKRKKNVSSGKSKFAKVEVEAVVVPPLSGGFRRQVRTNISKKQVRNEEVKVFVDPEKTRFENGSDYEDEVTGGPSTRLRKRVVKPVNKDFGTFTKPEPKQMKKKVKKNNNNISVSEMKVEETEGEYGCDMEGCNMSFESKQELIIHKKNICPVKGCGKKFFSHKYLVQHRRVHMDDRPLQCPWKGCKMTFKWAWARTEHIRVHTGARPYVCNEDGCGQTFRFVSDFSRHKRKTGHSVKKQVQER